MATQLALLLQTGRQRTNVRLLIKFCLIQFFYAPWLEEQNRARAPRAVAEEVSWHVIFTNFDDVAVNLIEKLAQYGIDYVIATGELQQALDLHDPGFRVVVGELDDPPTYRRLGVDRAALVVVLNDDIASTNIIYTIREIDTRVTIVTNADLADSLDILQLAALMACSSPRRRPCGPGSRAKPWPKADCDKQRGLPWWGSGSRASF